MTLFTVADRLKGLISMVILARLLVPEDFGIIAMSTSMIAGVELITALGFQVVLIQRPDPEPYHFHTAWTLNIFLALIAAILVVILAVPASRFFEEPRLVAIMQVLAISVLARGFENIQVVWFQKNLEFNKDFLFRFIPRLAGFFVTIPLAFYLRSYWALVSGMLFSTLFSVVFSYAIRPAMPRISLAGAKDLIDFSKWLLLTNIFAYMIVRGIDIVVGRTLGSFGLGTYSLSYELATIPTTQLTAPINRAVFPGYSRFAHDISMLREGFLDVTGIIALTALPAGIGIAAIADVLVPVVLGEKWLHAIPVVQLLAFYGSISSILTNVGPLFNSMARPYTITYLQILSICILLPTAYFFSVNYGVIGAGWAYVTTVLVSLPVTLMALRRSLGLHIGMLLAVIWRPIVACGLMYVAVLTYTGSAGSATVGILLNGILVGIAMYVLSLAAIWYLNGRPRGAEKVVFDQIRARVLAPGRGAP